MMEYIIIRKEKYFPKKMLIPKIHPGILAAKVHETNEKGWAFDKIRAIIAHDPVMEIVLEEVNDNAEALSAVIFVYDLINTQLEVSELERV